MTLQAIVKPKRGRPRRPETSVVVVRIRADVYDAYCRKALALDQPVRDLVRRAVTLHAPRD